ncbi:MAG: dihydrodipicolinate synthase family protein [Candidatus Binatia bacterium]|nr:MAG: dihydrodipicolinate synthase family protein [Candidatus Binatia bacterium]
MSLEDLGRIVPILPTPLDASGALDLEGLRHLVRFCAEEGFDGVVVLGSNGEFPYLTFDEKRRVMAAAVEAAAGRIPVIGTASAWATDHAVALARTARDVGCDAVLAALPTYWAVSADEAREHFAVLARESGLPVVFYYFPEATGLTLTPREIARIAAIDGVVGTKLTVTSARFLREVVDETRHRGWRVLTGTTFLLQECLAAGGAGVFCPLPLVAPALVREFYEALRRGDRGRSRRLRARVLRAVPLFSGVSASPRLQALGFRILARLPAGTARRRPRPTHGLLKEALRQRGHPLTAVVRPPLRPVTPAQQELVRRTLAELDRE